MLAGSFPCVSSEIHYLASDGHSDELVEMAMLNSIEIQDSQEAMCWDEI